MWTCLLVAVLCGCASAVTRDQFYPHGQGLDLRLPKGAEVPSPEIRLRVPITFYGQPYESIYVNNFGVLSFRTDIPSFMNAEFPLPYPAIAAFYSNIDTTESGSVFYRETDESHVLLKAEESVQNNFHEYYDFKPTSVFIATWSEVTFTGSDKKNSFQVAVISNGTESFVELLYPDRDIQWIQRDAKLSNLPEAKAQAGFMAEDGRMLILRGSGNHQIRNIVVWSNVHEPGKYVFRIGNISEDDNVAVPDQYNETEVEAAEESKTCAQSGPSVCHMQARCVDYAAGICCQCNAGFYGNGKSCIKNDVPLRVHGKLNGVINDLSFNDVDIQAYVVVSDGRTYTALSRCPSVLGNSLQLLNVLGGVVGWLFASPGGTAKNGYQLTGAVFNHTADILFPLTGDRVTINQEYIGHDVFDQITLDTDIRGSLPLVNSGSKLNIAEYEEQYSIVEPGSIRSESSRTFTDKVTGVQYLARITQTFTFKTCPFEQPSEEELIPSTLRVSKNYLGYEPKDDIVRYGMSNKIVPLGQEDPCIEGRNVCGPQSSCVVQGDSFACICKSGFTNPYTGDTRTCVDINECEIGTHNCDTNAECINFEGGFQCRCNAGYNGDGVRCTKVSQCQDKNCDVNAHCVENYEVASCFCNAGYEGDGISCWPAQYISCANCSPFASCIFDERSRTYRCQCMDGYRGDGLNCGPDNAAQVYTPTPPVPSTHYPTYSPPSTIEADYNGSVVLPSCDDVEGQCQCPDGYTSFKDDRNNDLCQINQENDSLKCETDTNCPPNAICSFSKTDPYGSGQCVCPEGYEGDAYECLERTVRGPYCACGPNEHCIENAARELICVCDVGYHGYNCRPNLACTNNSDCEYHAECRPDAGNSEYVCQCIEGYIKDQNDACVLDKQLCGDGTCAAHATCLYDPNIDRDYCQCDEGYDGIAVTECVLKESTCDVLNDCHADATCTRTETSYKCVCNDGFVGDGKSYCNLEPNCINNPYMCDAHASCLKRGDEYICECNTGYNGNGSICELIPRQSGNFLVASDGATIYKALFTTSSTRDFATPINSAVSQIAVSVDVDCETGRVYWGDVVGTSIRKAKYDGTGFEPFLNYDVVAPEGISIDWSARNIFWTDSRKLTIEVANLDTLSRKVLFSKNGITNPRGIVVHPQRGKVFWSDWNRNAPKIEWANMDGTERGVFVDQSEVKLPNSLAIDWARDRLCYADAGLNAIKCVGIDSLERETIAANCPYPFGLAINGDKFYWSDWRTLKIESIDTRTLQKSQVPIATASRRLYGVAIAPEECPPFRNVCQYRNGNCESGTLCLPDGRGGRTCAEPDN